MTTKAKRWLLHLSDIHFNKKTAHTENRYDLDTDLRDQLEADVARVCGLVGGKLDGVILSGDIAFAARDSEYDAATEWLKKLTEIAQCSPASVWCVPGNHDADRSVFDNSVHLRGLHQMLRPADPSLVDARLREILNDTEAAATLLRPFDNYNNRFASRYQCTTQPHQLHWEQRLQLNDASWLVLRGANSSLASNWSDDNAANKLTLGTLQATARERVDETVVFVCHHPLDWLRDYEALAPILNNRARVQLFGHKHSQTIDIQNNCLQIVAGATQPDRGEPKWRPRYNVLGFEVRSSESTRKLWVDVYPRIWSEEAPKFVPDYARCDGAQSKSYPLELPRWEPAPAPGVEKGSPPLPQAPPPTQYAEASDPEKTITYWYLNLSHLVRLEIAQAMKLLRDEDEGHFDAIVFERILERAANEGRLAELWDRVMAAADEASPMSNPYRSLNASNKD